jgi:hypothetical protein
MRNSLQMGLKVALTTAIVASSLVSGQNSAIAAVVTATGTSPSICDQTVSDATYVTATRLAGGDCVLTITSGTVTWTSPANLKSVKILLVGGGGGGGGSYDTAGAGGGGGGQALLLNSRRISPAASYTINVGVGGPAGYHVGRTNAVEAIGQPGGATTFSGSGIPVATAFGGGGGGSSRANPAGAVSRVGGAAATLTAGSIGGGAGGGGYSGGGGGGSSGQGGNGSTVTPAVAVPGGSGTSIDISGTTITYGTGGAGGVQNGSTSVDGVAGTSNTGNGGSGASVAGSTFKNGGAGGSGVVILRYSTTPPVFSDLSITGSPRVAVVKANNTISATVNVSSLITFYAGKTRIAGCISIATTGASTNNVATCTWKPTVKASVVISAEATPTAPGISGSSTANIPVSVNARTNTR